MMIDYCVQWTNRATSVIGGSLLLVGTSNPDNPNSPYYNRTGGVIAIMAPFVETFTSYLNDKVYDVKQKKWDEFINDTKNMIDNYHELLGIIEKITIGKLGTVNEALKNLDKATDSFLKDYDQDKNWTIDVSELITKRSELAADLEKRTDSQLRKIVSTIEKLENEIIKYQQGLVDKENIQAKSKAERQVQALQIQEPQQAHIEIVSN